MGWGGYARADICCEYSFWPGMHDTDAQQHAHLVMRGSNTSAKPDSKCNDRYSEECITIRCSTPCFSFHAELALLNATLPCKSCCALYVGVLPKAPCKLDRTPYQLVLQAVQQEERVAQPLCVRAAEQPLTQLVSRHQAVKHHPADEQSHPSRSLPCWLAWGYALSSPLQLVSLGCCIKLATS